MQTSVSRSQSRPAPSSAEVAASAAERRIGELETQVAEQRALLVDLARQLSGETARLAEARRQVGHAEKLRLLGQFVGSVVHDINNVLAVMQATANLLERRTPKGLNGDILNQAGKSIARGQQLVRQLLDFARTDSTQTEVVSPFAILQQDAALLQRLAGGVFELKFVGDAEPWRVLVEPARLQTVVFNLVANARDACAEGGEVTVNVSNVAAPHRPQGAARRDYVKIEVADTGTGMAPEALKRAGEPFFTTKGPGKGTGLGLASAFELADRCRGRVVIDSLLGLGTRVALFLPRAAALGEAIAAPDEAVESAKHGGATLLVVEGEEMPLAHRIGLLRSLGYAVIEAASGELAFANALSGVAIDLAIVNIGLGSGSGVRLADRLRQDRPDLPVIFVGGTSGMGVPSGELVLRSPVSEGVLARAVLERLGRLPASALTAKALTRSDRVGRRIGDSGLRALFAAWRTRSRTLGRLPSPDDAREIMRLQPDNSYLIEVVGEEAAPSFRFRAAGWKLAERLGRSLTGETVVASQEDLIGNCANAYRRCLDGIPYFDFARLRFGADALRFERLLMPLTDDGERVSHLLGAVAFEDTKATYGDHRHDAGL